MKIYKRLFSETPEQINTPEFKKWFGKSKVVDKSGKPLVVYHGSNSKGITTFRKNFDGIWFTDDIAVAEKINGVKGLSQVTHSKNLISLLNSDNDIDAMFTGLKKLGFTITSEVKVGIYGDKKRVIILIDPDGKSYEISEYTRPQDLKHELIKKGQNYALFLKITNPLIVECKGKEWDNVIFNGENTSTMHISQYAQKNKYDGVIFKNLYEYNVKSTVYAVFNPNQIKSATGNNGNFNPRSGNILEGYRGDDLGSYHLSSGTSNFYWGNQGAGLIVYCKNEVLLGLRSKYVNEPNTWGFPGGKIDDNEDPKKSAIREFYEETSYKGKISNIKLLNTFEDKENDFKYYTYIAEIPEKFEPILDWETSKFEWFDIDNFPNHLHFGLKGILQKLKRFVK